ncbi:hypothetical protein BJX99DRAFT_235912 [Aspergillus californicus]
MRLSNHEPEFWVSNRHHPSLDPCLCFFGLPIGNTVIVLSPTQAYYWLTISDYQSSININPPSPERRMDKDKSPRRHWHGSMGDRYEHHNVWVRGGPSSKYMATRPSTSTTDAIASSDRRASSASDTSANATADRGSPPTVGERRKSSGHGPSTLFESLTSQKRNSNDSTFAARRQSWNEQSQPGGYFSKWWDGFTRGGNKDNK